MVYVNEYLFVYCFSKMDIYRKKHNAEQVDG